MARIIEVLDPTAQAEIQTVRLAPRLADLDGKVIAFLDNSKPNADLLLARVEELLSERFHFAQVLHARKRSVAAPVSPETLEELAAKAHVVVNAIGD